MAVNKPNVMQGFGRGCFGLKNFDPLRKPKGRGFFDRPNGDVNSSRPGQFNQGPPARSENVRHGGGNVPSQQPQAPRSQAPQQPQRNDNGKEVLKKGTPLRAGYSYKANENSPLGHELSFKPNDNLRFIEVHETNPEWWVAEAADGTLGYVPAKYMISCEVKHLPWLKGGEEEIAEAEKPVGTNVFGVPEKSSVFKPYRSSYDHEEIGVKQNQTAKTMKWECDICEKEFNGPQPYKAHMASKAHREEVEYRQGGP